MDNHPFKNHLGLKLFGPLLLIAIVAKLGAVITIATLYKGPRTATEQFLLLGAIVVILLVSLTLLLSWLYLRKKIIYPLHLLRDSMVRLAQGDLKHPIQRSVYDEPENLVDEFNGMALRFLESRKALANIANENEQLYREAQRRVKELDLINQINQTLLASVDMEVTIDAVLRNIKPLFEYTAAEINIWNEDEGVLKAHAVGETSYTNIANNCYTQDEGYTGWIFRHRQPLGIPNISNFSKVYPKLPLGEFPFKSYVGVPLMVGNDFLGTLELVHLQPNTYSQEDADSLSVVANQTAVALRHAKLFQENRQHARAQAELAGIASLAGTTLNIDTLLQSIMRKTVAALGAKLGAVLLLSKNETELYAHPAGAVGISPEDAKSLVISTSSPQFQKSPLHTGRSFLLSNVQTDDRIPTIYQPFIQQFDITTLMVVPLTTADRNVGEIYIANKSIPFTHHDLVFLSSVAVHFASAIINSKLFEATQHNLAELSLLYEAAADLSSTLAIEEVLSNLTKRLVGTLPVDECVISLYNEADQTLETIENNDLSASSITKLPKNYLTSVYPVIARVFQTQKLATIDINHPDIGEGERALLAASKYANLLILPLVVSNQTIGLVELYAKEHIDYQPDEISLAQALANQAAIALQNARLYTEADAQLNLRVQELRGLHKIIRELNSTLDPETIMRVLIASISQKTILTQPCFQLLLLTAPGC